MSKIVGIHTLELKPGVTVEEFETFAKDRVPSFVQTTPDYSGTI